ncbi:MAG: ATP-grasp domain-containing protein [Acidimicrobiales bacterium]
MPTTDSSAARVALVTTDERHLFGGDPDMAPLLGALRDLGMQAEATPWIDADVRWDRFDLVVMRSPWDYSGRAADFLAWLGRVRAEVPVLNCPDLIAWNLDKHYIADLASAGVSCVPSVFCNSVDEYRAALTTLDVAEIVIKPAVSAGARDTGWFAAGAQGAADLVQIILDSHKTVIVQPSVPGVSDRGEVGVVFFDGEPSHAFTKGPLLARGGGLLGGRYNEQIGPTRPDGAVLAVAKAAMAAIPDLVRDRGCCCENPVPLYGRIDVVVGPEQGPMLLEAELFEPSYYCHVGRGSETRFARAVQKRIAAGRI